MMEQIIIPDDPTKQKGRVQERWLSREEMHRAQNLWPWDKHPVEIVARFAELATELADEEMNATLSHDDLWQKVREYRLIAQMIYKGLTELELKRIEDLRDLQRRYISLGLEPPKEIV